MPLNSVLRRFAFYGFFELYFKKQASETSEACFVYPYLVYLMLYTLFCEAGRRFYPQD